MKRKSQDITPLNKQNKPKRGPYSNRLHYHWSQLEDDRSGKLLGSWRRPVKKADRVLHMHPERKYGPLSLASKMRRSARFRLCASTYQTIDYNTFEKNGIIKLTEVEMYFLSSKMTKSSSSEWAVVYLGIGNGERFRWLRDEFFPGLSVVAFDPLDEFFTGVRHSVEKDAERWSNDGTNFTFLIRCFDDDTDVSWIHDKLRGKRLLVISDIRGMCFLKDGVTFDKRRDQDIQWRAIQRIRPEASLVKFNLPSSCTTSFTYAPGVLLKQIYTYYGTLELRLLIDGVPEQMQRYSGWELMRKLAHHHESLRGLVYRSTRRDKRLSCKCLDCCFDCTVLWDTISAYARKSGVDAYEVLDKIRNDHIYIQSNWTRRRADVEFFIGDGRLGSAVAALEAGGHFDEELVDWGEVIEGISARQPALAERLRLELRGPSSRGALMRLLGSLSAPFTLTKSELNGLLEYPPETWRKNWNRQDMSLYKAGPCWFFWQGKCTKGEFCTYQHGEADAGAQAPWTSDLRCWYDAKGCCKRGNGCIFRHEGIAGKLLLSNDKGRHAGTSKGMHAWDAEKPA